MRRTRFSDALVDGLIEWGVEAFAHVPSSHVAPVIRGLEERGVRGYLANREDEALGMAGGLALGGRRAAVVMQDNGFGNALTALATFLVAYRIGVPIVANARGGPGEYNSMIHSFSEAAPDLLRDVGVRVEHLAPGDGSAVWEVTTRAACELATTTHRPVVILAEMLHPLVEGEA